MNIALVDHCPEDRLHLKNALMEYSTMSGHAIDLSVFASGEELLAGYRPLKYTVIFLDTILDGMTGIEAAEKIRAVDDDTLLVFLTASNDRQSEAIHWHVYDYLYKSDGTAAIWNVMDRILRKSFHSDTRYFFFTWERKSCSLRYPDIVSVQADGNHIIIDSRGGAKYHPRMTFSAAREALMTDKRFLEIMRGILVNMDYILEFTDTSCILNGNIYLPVNVRKSKSIIHIWQNYLFAQGDDA